MSNFKSWLLIIGVFLLGGTIGFISHKYLRSNTSISHNTIVKFSNNDMLYEGGDHNYIDSIEQIGDNLYQIHFLPYRDGGQEEYVITTTINYRSFQKIKDIKQGEKTPSEQKSEPDIKNENTGIEITDQGIYSKGSETQYLDNKYYEFHDNVLTLKNIKLSDDELLKEISLDIFYDGDGDRAGIDIVSDYWGIYSDTITCNNNNPVSCDLDNIGYKDVNKQFEISFKVTGDISITDVKVRKLSTTLGEVK